MDMEGEEGRHTSVVVLEYGKEGRLVPDVGYVPIVKIVQSADECFWSAHGGYQTGLVVRDVE